MGPVPFINHSVRTPVKIANSINRSVAGLVFLGFVHWFTALADMPK